jgi:hypothetical protein
MPGTNNDNYNNVKVLARDKRNPTLLKYPETIGIPHTHDDGLEQIRAWLEFKDSSVSQYEKYSGKKGPFTSDLDIGTYGTIENSLAITKSAIKSNTAIHLYIPPVINVNGGVNWGESEFSGSFGAARSNKYADFGGSADAIEGALRKMAGKFVDGDESGIDFQKKHGVIQNMNKQLLFEGVGMRTFEFEFEFVPKSKNEAEVVYKIVKWFRSRMYPNFDNVWYTVPDSISISFRSSTGRGKNKDMSKLPKIKDSVITSCNITYGSEGVFGIMEGDTEYPYSTTMTLSLQELEVITSEDVSVNGGY